MKKVLYITILFSFSRHFLGQTNLVPNWSFETYTLCPNASSQLQSAIPWFDPQTYSSDYFNACAPVYNVPSMTGDYQQAKDGVAFAGIYLKNGGLTYREYLQVQLTNTLITSSCYYAEFFINMSSYSGTAVNNASANFSSFAYPPGPSTELSVPSHITNYGNPIIKDTLNWVKVSGTYVASGNEQYITIGNFKNDASTTMTNIPTGIGNIGYYYIDAVSVFSINPTGTLPWKYNDTIVNYGDSVYIGNYLGGNFSSNWYLQGGGFIKNGSGLYVKPTVTSNYIVQFTLCGVPRADTLKVTVIGGASINEFSIKNSELLISPNPNNGLINIEILNKDIVLQNSSIKIYDVFNREIKTFKLSSKKQEVGLQDLNNGVYYLQILQDNKVLQTKKIIKQ